MEENIRSDWGWNVFFYRRGLFCSIGRFIYRFFFVVFVIILEFGLFFRVFRVGGLVVVVVGK